MATEKLRVEIDAALNAESTLKGLRELKRLQREVVNGSEDYKKIQARINDISDSAKTARLQSQDWIDTLGGLPGPLGMIGRGLDTFTSSTNKLGLAFKSLGIGLIVSAVGALTAAFSQNEKMTKKLEPLMIAFEQILGGIFAALEPVINMMIELAVKAMPLVSSAIKVVYSGISALLQSLGKLGSALYKVFTGDFTGAIDDAKSAFTDFSKNYTEATANFEKGSKELTKTEKKNAEERSKAAETEAQKRKKVIDDINQYIQKGQEARGKTQEEELASAKKTYDELIKNAKKYGFDTAQITKSYSEIVAKIQKDYLQKTTEEEQKEFDKRYKNLQDANNLSLNQLQANFEQQRVLYGENSKQARQAQDIIFQQQKKNLEDEKKILESKKVLTQEETNRLIQIGIEQQKLTTTITQENNKRTQSDVETFLKNAENRKKAQDTEFEDKMKAAATDFELSQQILDAKKEQDRLYYEGLLSNEKLTADQRKKIEEDFTNSKKQNAETQIQIEQKKFEAQQKLLGATVTAITAVADLVGKNTAAGKALAVAASLINTYATIAAQLRAFAGVPIPGYAIVQAVATGLVGFKAVADIIKTPVPQGMNAATPTAPQQAQGAQIPRPRGMYTGGLVSGPGSGRSDLIPAMLSNGESVINSQSTSLFRPLLSRINEIGGGKRFADGGLAVGSFSQTQALQDLQSSLMTQQQPIRTYVVSSDMTSQQMMDRNIKSRSTI